MKHWFSVVFVLFFLTCSLQSGLLAQWSQTNGPTGANVFSLVVIGSNLFASIDGKGVFRSPDNGESWTPVNNGLTDIGTVRLVVSGANLYAGIAWGGGVFRSTDNGESWTAINTGLTNTNVTSLAVDGANLYVKTNDGVFHSTDDGASWVIANNGLSGLYVNCLAIVGSYVFAGTNTGFYRSSNGGNYWEASNDGLSTLTIRCFMVKGSNLYAGTDGNTNTGSVFCSTNNGRDWVSLNPHCNGSAPSFVRCLVVNGSALYGGTLGGSIHRTTDNGNTWGQIDTGLSCNRVYCLAANNSNIFAGTNNGGVYRSADNGLHWIPVNAGLISTTTNCLIVDGANLFAAGFHLSRSTDHGTSWSSADAGMPDYYFPSFNSIIVGNAFLFAGTSWLGVYRSSNHGGIWIAANSGLADNGLNVSISCLTTDGSNLYMGTMSGNGAFRSTDDGDNWTPIIDSASGSNSFNIRCLFVHGSSLFAVSTRDGVIRSTDHGDTWTSANTGLRTFEVTCFAAHQSDIFAGANGSVYHSSDDGAHWVLSDGYHNSYGSSVLCLAFNGPVLFAGTTNGVYRSIDNGATWITVNTGLPATEVRTLLFDGSVCFAGVRGNGVWSRPVSELLPPSITPLAGPHGTISPSETVYLQDGANQSFSITPDPGYYIDSVFVNDVYVDSLTGYTFFNVTSNQTIRATFALMNGRITMADGWNLISVPRNVSDGHAAALFPTATSPAYRFQNGFQSTDMLTNHAGYWLKFPQAQWVEIPGDSIMADTIDLVQGWNIVGSITAPAPVANIASLTEGLTTSNFIGYDGTYARTDVIEPGKGYWVKANQDGRIILSAAPLAGSKSRLRVVPSGEAPPTPPGEIATNRPELPVEFSLAQNYPNPFNPTTVVSYTLPEESRVTLKIFTPLGQEIATLVEKTQQAGAYQANWNAAHLSSGIYFYRLDAFSAVDATKHFSLTRKMLLVR